MVFDRAVMAFKIVSILCPEGLRNELKERSALSNYNSRNMKNVHVLKLKLEHTEKSFLFTAPNGWNSISQAIRNAEIIARFKKGLESHILS